MKLVKYKVIRLNEPVGDNTHQLVYESISKHKQSGGCCYGIKHIGTFKECQKIKKEIENENTEDDYFRTS